MNGQAFLGVVVAGRFDHLARLAALESVQRGSPAPLVTARRLAIDGMTAIITGLARALEEASSVEIGGFGTFHHAGDSIIFQGGTGTARMFKLDVLERDPALEAISGRPPYWDGYDFTISDDVFLRSVLSGTFGARYTQGDSFVFTPAMADEAGDIAVRTFFETATFLLLRKRVVYLPGFGELKREGDVGVLYSPSDQMVGAMRLHSLKGVTFSPQSGTLIWDGDVAADDDVAVREVERTLRVERYPELRREHIARFGDFVRRLVLRRPA